MAMENILKQLEEKTQRDLVERDELDIAVERRDTSNGIAFRHLSCLSSMSSLQRTTLEERLPTGL